MWAYLECAAGCTAGIHLALASGLGRQAVSGEELGLGLAPALLILALQQRERAKPVGNGTFRRYVLLEPKPAWLPNRLAP